MLSEEDIRGTIKTVGEFLTNYAQGIDHGADSRRETINQIRDLIEAKTPTALEVYVEFADSLDSHLDQIRTVRGIPFSSVIGADLSTGRTATETSTDQKPEPLFDKYFPAFIERVKYCKSNYKAKSEKFRADSISEYLGEIEYLLGDATAMPKIDTEFRKRITATKRDARWVIKWGRVFDAQQRLSYMSELAYFSACLNESIALIWRYSEQDDPEEFQECAGHAKLDGNVFALRDNWALESGEMVVGPAGYMDEIELPGYALGCMCHLEGVSDVRKLPVNMRTEKKPEKAKRASSKPKNKKRSGPSMMSVFLIAVFLVLIFLWVR